VRVTFLADVQSLCEQAAQVQALDTLRAFHRDRLTYRQEQVGQGLTEPDTLWTETDAVQRAEHEWRREAGKLQVQQLTLARAVWRAAWDRLGALLGAMTRAP
jgi:hypothetical protein